MQRKPRNKYNWSRKQINFIKKNYSVMTNTEMADALGLKLYALRNKCISMGLKRMELEYWKKVQINFLLRKYKTIGDKEIAEIFERKWPKQKGWTKKHIEKKRKYLGLKRTKEELVAIKTRNKKRGCFALCAVHAWKSRGVSPEGTVRYWKKFDQPDKTFPVIRVKGGYVHWGVWAWQQAYRKIPKGKNVVFKDGNNRNLDINNLILVSNSELARRNLSKSSQGLLDNYVIGILTHKNPYLRKILKQDPALVELKRQQLKLNRAIYEHQQT